MHALNHRLSLKFAQLHEGDIESKTKENDKVSEHHEFISNCQVSNRRDLVGQRDMKHNRSDERRTNHTEASRHFIWVKNKTREHDKHNKHDWQERLNDRINDCSRDWNGKEILGVCLIVDRIVMFSRFSVPVINNPSC